VSSEIGEVHKNDKWYIHTANYTNKHNEFSCEKLWEFTILVILNAPTITGVHNEILTSSEAKGIDHTMT